MNLIPDLLRDVLTLIISCQHRYLEDYGDYESENEIESEEYTPVLSGYSNMELPIMF